MAAGPSKAEINREFTCSNRKCKKKCEEIHLFTQYGNEARREEYLKGNSYCEECFDKKEEQLRG